jgi:hypothetical protein
MADGKLCDFGGTIVSWMGRMQGIGRVFDEFMKASDSALSFVSI